MSAAVVDTSVWIAVAFNELDAPTWVNKLSHLDSVLISSVSRVELGIVGLSRGPLMLGKVNHLLDTFKAEIVPFDVQMALVAIDASTQYGKGRHKASLNFGDCCAYALAKSRGLPLLYKGDDFAQTDAIRAP
jgi:ribonuclease VapC